MADPLGLIGNSGGVQPGNVRPKPQQPADPNQASFKDVLMDNIKQVNQLQQDAEKAIEDLASGKREDLSNVLMAKQKADTAFKMLQQVRNKIVDAYEEVKDMRV